jgi:uncharacterized protein (DUF4415 family)
MTISAQRIEELKNLPDSEIDTSDIPELDQNFWDNAKLVQPRTEQAISIRLDSDVLDWFKIKARDISL